VRCLAHHARHLTVGKRPTWCRIRARRGIKYGFTITVLEGPSTIPTLWEHTRGFMQRNADLIPEDNLMEFVTGRDGEYNLCHFWSNFELGDLRFFRSQVRWSCYTGNTLRKGWLYDLSQGRRWAASRNCTHCAVGLNPGSYVSVPCCVIRTASVLWLRLCRRLIGLRREHCIRTGVSDHTLGTPQAYEEYFKYLDRTGGFFYERWGDAPVHSLGAVMLLNSTQVRPSWAYTGSWTLVMPGLPQAAPVARSGLAVLPEVYVGCMAQGGDKMSLTANCCMQIHHFGDIGYRHNSFTNCPAKLRNNCACDAMKSVDFHSPLNSFGQCHSLWKKVMRDKAAAAAAMKQ